MSNAEMPNDPSERAERERWMTREIEIREANYHGSLRFAPVGGSALSLAFESGDEPFERCQMLCGLSSP